MKIVKENAKLLTILNEVHELIEIEQRNTDKKHIELRQIIPQEIKNVNLDTDPSKFKQILINLLKNALKFTPTGYVEYGLSNDNDFGKAALKFYVKDTGIGIPKKKRELIFEMFRQVEESHSRKYGGAGIRLSIAKKLTELLGGKIWIDPEYKKGSIFYFTIPYKDCEVDKNNKAPETRNIYKLKNKTILVVEDDKACSNYLKIVLAKLGAIIICAENGEIAVESIKKIRRSIWF